MKPENSDDPLNRTDSAGRKKLSVTQDNGRDRTVLGAFFTGLIAIAATAIPFYGIYVYHGWNIGLFIALAFGMLHYLIIAYLVDFNDFDPDFIHMDSGVPEDPGRYIALNDGEVS